MFTSPVFLDFPWVTSYPHFYFKFFITSGNIVFMTSTFANKIVALSQQWKPNKIIHLITDTEMLPLFKLARLVVFPESLAKIVLWLQVGEYLDEINKLRKNYLGNKHSARLFYNLYFLKWFLTNFVLFSWMQCLL